MFALLTRFGLLRCTGFKIFRRVLAIWGLNLLYVVTGILCLGTRHHSVPWKDFYVIRIQLSTIVALSPSRRPGHRRNICDNIV